MVPRVFRAAVDWCWTRGSVCVCAAVGEGDELGECVGSVRSFEEGGVADLLMCALI